MAVEVVVVGGVQRRIAALWPHLSERQRRLLLGAEARELGWGGVSTVARAVGVSRSTVTVTVAEVERPPELAEGRSRRAGGGRKTAVEKDVGRAAALDALVDPETRGDPESPLRWTCKSTRTLAAASTAAGHPVSDRTTAALLRQAVIACRRTRRPWRAASIRTGTGSSATSTMPSAGSCVPLTR